MHVWANTFPANAALCGLSACAAAEACPAHEVVAVQAVSLEHHASAGLKTDYAGMEMQGSMH